MKYDEVHLVLGVFSTLFSRFVEGSRKDISDFYSYYSYRDKEHRARIDKHISKGSYYFIPNGATLVAYTLLGLMEHFKQFKSVSFLDAGCGIGNIVVIAQVLGFKAFGLELDDKAIEAFKTKVADVMMRPVDDPGDGLDYVHKPSRPDWFKGRIGSNMVYPIAKQDIMKFKNYGNYDVVYYYCPFSDVEREKRFERRVENQMKKGAVLIPADKRDGRITKDKRFELLKVPSDSLTESCYIKVRK